MTNTESAIVIKDLKKSFHLPLEHASGLKQLVVNFAKQKKGYETQHVLKGVSFDIKKGEFFGIVGRNGSGKSTLLKLLAGIYVPDEGLIQVNGSLTPFIELGVGFNPELSGRDNVFLNGSLLGFSRKEMLAMYDDIVEFAEIGRFMDQKLKNYSSGMQVRLAFSIAIRAETDILLIDEVLAVGDANFQRKCLDKFAEIKKSGRTVILISHDMGAIRKFCDRVIMIQDGKIIDEGRPDEVASVYEVANIEKAKTVDTINEDIETNKNKIITNIKLLDTNNNPTTMFASGDKVKVHLKLKPGSPAKNLGIAVYAADGGYVFGTNTVNDKHRITEEVIYEFTAAIGSGEYMLKLGVFGDDDSVVYEFFDEGPSFIVESDKHQKWQGITELSHEWSNL